MKINRIKNEYKFGFCQFISTFVKEISFFLFTVFAAALVAFAVIFFADVLAHPDLESLNSQVTLQLFDELQCNNRHHDAIALMEYKSEVFNDPEIESIYKSKLSDSYINVGDFSKAEKVLFDSWYSTLSCLDNEATEDISLVNFCKFQHLRQIFLFYEKMGDKRNMKKFYDEYRKYQDVIPDTVLAISESTSQSTKESIKLLYKIQAERDSIVISYFDSHASAIVGMGNLVDAISQGDDFGIHYKLKCLNTLIGWLLNDNQLYEAYHRIRQAVVLASYVQVVDDFEPFGELSDYCYKIHDVKMSEVLYNRYEFYLKQRHSEDDLVFLMNYSRKFRYYKDEDDWQTFEAELIKYCTGLREKISSNIPTMTEEQREHFVRVFDGVYSAAINALQKHPSPKLAELCFDNISFRSGLLLRSNMAIKNSVYGLNDSSTIALYDSLVKCRVELVYESISTKLFSKTTELQNRINDLEKELALQCADFKTDKDNSNYLSDVLSKYIAPNDVVVELVENNDSLFALVLCKNKGVEYVPIGNFCVLQHSLNESIEDFYHDKNVGIFLWDKINAVLPKVSNVNIFYMPVGKFNQISLGSLYLGNDKYLCDCFSINLLQDFSHIVAKNNFHSRNVLFANLGTTKMISLWGGIDYGVYSSSSQTRHNSRRAFKRGDALVSLPYTKLEVDGISYMLNNKLQHNHVYSDIDATESSFKMRSGEGDYILHVSTHGFFNDSISKVNSMLSSGLFFAGANTCWCNDSLTNTVDEDNDGLLRAAEIANLNLSGCSLAVLSACETGLGFSESSEGVFGLQRAFKLAGVKQILMSLWEVDDTATQILMENFYKHLLEGKPANEALELSKQSVREQYSSPFYWGAFVLLQ